MSALPYDPTELLELDSPSQEEQSQEEQNGVGAKQPNELDRNLSPVENKAITLLGSGLSQRVVSDTLGVSESRISQLMALTWFADRVAALRFESATKYRKMDDEYDVLEEKLQKKLKASLPMMFKPTDILKAIQVINAAKRRSVVEEGMGSISQATIVNLTLPTQIINKFVVNANNQVVEVDGQSLVTVSTQALTDKVKEKSHVPITDDTLESPVLREGQAISIHDLI